MKLDRMDNREPQQVRVTLSAATHEKLQAYLEYTNSNGNGQGFMDLKQLVAEICRAFVERGDKDFALWLRTKTQASMEEITLNAPKKEKQSRRENGAVWAQQNDTVAKASYATRRAIQYDTMPQYKNVSALRRAGALWSDALSCALPLPVEHLSERTDWSLSDTVRAARGRSFGGILPAKRDRTIRQRAGLYWLWFLVSRMDTRAAQAHRSHCR